MELDKIKLELTWDEVDILLSALICLRNQRKHEIEVYQQRIEDPRSTPESRERAANLLSSAQNDLKLLEQARLGIRKAQLVEPIKEN